MSGQILAIASGKGGMGKSMLTATLGALLAGRGKKVALLDMNTGMRGLDMLLGLESRIVFDLGDVLDGLCDARRALVEDRRTGIRLLAARQIADTQTLDEEALCALTAELAQAFDVVLLDAAGGIGAGFSASARAAGSALLVTTPDDAALRAAERAAGLLARLDMPPPSLVINRIRPDFVEEGLQYAPDACAQVLDMRVLGIIPDDVQVWRQALKKEPALGNFPAAQAMENLLDRMENAKIPLRPWRAESTGGTNQKKGLFSRFKRHAEGEGKRLQG